MHRFAIISPLAPLLGLVLCASMLPCALAQAGDAPAPAPAPAATPTPKPPVRQVRVEVRVLEWRLTNSTDFDFAVLFTGGAGTTLSSADLTLPSTSPLSSAARIFLSGLDAGSGGFEAVIEALETVGEVRVLHQPTMIVTIGAGALKNAAEKDPGSYSGKVESGSRIPYESVTALGGVRLASITEYQDTGVTLECDAPAIKYDEFVELQIRASVTDLTGFIKIGLNNEGNAMRVPVTETREVNNHVLVRDRSVFIAGLLKSTRQVERRRGIPWISEIPGFRSLLTNLSKESEVVELVFLFRPEILDPVEME